MKHICILLIATATLALGACGAPDMVGTAADPNPETTSSPATTPSDTTLHPKLADVSAATYSIEPTHAFLNVKVGHGAGISAYKIAFTRFEGDLDFDPAAPENARLTFTIHSADVETNYPGDYKAGHADSQWQSWNEDVARDAKWLNADLHPEITFVSTAIERTGELTGKVTGDLTLLGVTQPVTLDVTYNGVANPPWFGGRDVIGFDASTQLNRSEFGMGAYIPNISDTVEVNFSGEFLENE